MGVCACCRKNKNTRACLAKKPKHAAQNHPKHTHTSPRHTRTQRANVYCPLVSTFTLRSTEPASKWVLASVALLLQDELAP